jgi:hypothetical protein
MDVEILAKALHEAGREAVEKGATVAADKFGEQTRTFLSWEEISENAKEGRRIQARYLLNHFAILSLHRWEEVKADLLFLHALQDAGVDNWEGYDEAMASYQDLILEASK